MCSRQMKKRVMATDGAFVPDDFVPKVGDPIEGESVVMITEAVIRRQKNFPDEPLEQTLPLILLNIGRRFDPLRCENGEWKGYKKDVKMVPGEDPTCPNGHGLIKKHGVTLGWVIDNT